MAHLVIEPKSVCLMLQKAKTQMSEFGVRKGLLMEKVPTERLGDLMMPQIHLACCTRSRVLKGLGQQVYERCWWGKF